MKMIIKHEDGRKEVAVTDIEGLVLRIICGK